ncbi:OLC1v1015549C1 [Oldenlandia corymbosa var. corymbosa]|nr:OLC1v1015549C1 [Oldenlandia corymbosa var. corymbosa]
MLDEDHEDMVSKLELISDLDRLGVSYHLQEKIKSILREIHNGFINASNEKGCLYTTALGFRLLRHYGFHVSQDVFNCFLDEEGKFEQQHLKDRKGLLPLYEASYLEIENENTLKLARDFAAKNLKRSLGFNKNLSPHLAELVQHSLELPLHWRMPRAEARWFIDIYEKLPDSDLVLLEFAKLDFNIVQATHQEDLKFASRWWNSTGLAERLSFVRDRVVENFYWTIGETFEPEHGYCRRISTKINALLTAVDDIYDVYGTLEELQLFTEAIERWDMEVMDQLPYYMKICYLAVFNAVNELAYDVLRDQGVHIISHLKKPWLDICRAYLKEARWYYSGYKPTLEEFMEDGWISSASPTMILHTFFCVTNPISKDGLECLDKYPEIVRLSTTIVRYADDLGTSSDELARGDVPKSIQCYMHDNTGVNEEDARDYIKYLIGQTWKRVNRERVANSPFCQTFIRISVNLCRMSQSLYLYGDGHGHSNPQTKAEIESLLFHPIHLFLPDPFVA